MAPLARPFHVPIRSIAVAGLSRFIISHLAADVIGSCFSPVHVQMVLSVLQVTALCLHDREAVYVGMEDGAAIQCRICLGGI